MRLRKNKGMAIGSTGKMNERKTNRWIRLAGLRARLFQVKERRSPLRLNVSGRERQRRVVPGIQEHENRVQLSPGKGYLIGNESEILCYLYAVVRKKSSIKRTCLFPLLEVQTNKFLS
jgi:hypothetical protein